jgi:antitoxin component of MazEF toxin-antitoxin module
VLASSLTKISIRERDQYILVIRWIIGDDLEIDIDNVRYITETSLTIRGTRRRTTVPKTLVEKLGLKDGSKIRWILFRDGTVLIRKVAE